jgi:ornithine cyclodeaminase/alanine dehydrogenase-like protein (mu-crystallin family)
VHGSAIIEAISPGVAIERVRSAFVAHHAGSWQMPSKVYLTSPPNGDFRAMPARGDGVALLKWVTSFPPNSRKGLPVVMATVLLNDASDGRPLAIMDGAAVTALRTGAAAAVASSALASPGAATAGVIGCGLHGLWAARCLKAAGYAEGICFDLDPAAARRVADDVGWTADSLDRALAGDVVTTVTPGHEPVVGTSHLAPGRHFNALGADGPGKAEFEPEAVAGCRLFCDEWDQASHGGELTPAITRGLVDRARVTELGAVLAGDAPGRAGAEDITLFDSTGLAIQDLAIALAVLDGVRDGSIPSRTVEL